MREEYSDRKLFFGMALKPQNRASPSSATSAMMWLLRSIDHSLRASEARSACAAGIMREPGSFASRASASVSRRTRSAMNRNSPPIRDKLGGIVEVDETFVGGLAKNRHKDKRGGGHGTGGIGS